jgi:hypothetical protein
MLKYFLQVLNNDKTMLGVTFEKKTIAKVKIFVQCRNILAGMYIQNVIDQYSFFQFSYLLHPYYRNHAGFFDNEDVPPKLNNFLSGFFPPIFEKLKIWNPDFPGNWSAPALSLYDIPQLLVAPDDLMDTRHCWQSK